MPTSVVIKFCTVSLFFEHQGRIWKTKRGIKKGPQGGSLSQNWKSHSFLAWGWSDTGAGISWPTLFSLGKSQWKSAFPSHTISPFLPYPGNVQPPWACGRSTLQRAAVGSVGQQSLVFTPPGAQGFEQTNSGETLKSLAIQWHFRTHKFRINQSRRFLKLSSQWHPILQRGAVRQYCQPLESV